MVIAVCMDNLGYLADDGKSSRIVWERAFYCIVFDLDFYYLARSRGLAMQHTEVNGHIFFFELLDTLEAVVQAVVVEANFHLYDFIAGVYLRMYGRNR
jgi:hypothetical protein